MKKSIKVGTKVKIIRDYLGLPTRKEYGLPNVKGKVGVVIEIQTHIGRTKTPLDKPRIVVQLNANLLQAAGENKWYVTDKDIEVLK